MGVKMELIHFQNMGAYVAWILPHITKNTIHAKSKWFAKLLVHRKTKNKLQPRDDSLGRQV